jgi:hypothetical protein
MPSLIDAILTSQEVLQEWSLLNGMFGDIEEVRECKRILAACLLARSQANSFRATLAALTFIPMRRSRIRACQWRLQNPERIDVLPKPIH